MKLSTILLVSILSSQVGCSSISKQEIIYTNDSHELWKKELLLRCKHESIKLTLFMYEANLDWPEEKVKGLERRLMDSCIRFYKLDI